MDADEAKAFVEVMEMMETEPSGASTGPALVQPDIPARREQLTILVSTGTAKEAVGLRLSTRAGQALY